MLINLAPRVVHRERRIFLPWNCSEAVRAWADYYLHYRERDRRRGLRMGLSFAQFREMSLLPCVYCGDPPSGSPIARNTLDRIDSSGGYTAGNVVPCCTVCNLAKKDMSLDTFHAWLDRVVSFHTAGHVGGQSVES